MGAECLFADPENIAPDVAEIERIETQNFGALIEIGEHYGKIFRRSGAYVAQVLRDDEVGRETAQRFGVDRITTFAARAQFTNTARNYGRRGGFWNAR